MARRHSVARWLRDKALLCPGSPPYAIRLTPGQYQSLVAETGNGTHIETTLGMHPVSAVHYYGRAIYDNVILAPRLDLFSDSEFGCVSTANEVTSTPDNVALVEVICPGNSVHLSKGDLVFIDMYRTKQGHELQGDLLYVANGADFIARYDEQTMTISAIDDHVLLKPAKKRMALAMYGRHSVAVPEMILTDGFCSAKRSDGRASAHCLYQEVYSVGQRGRKQPLKLTRSELALLDAAGRWLADDTIDADEMSGELAIAIHDAVAGRGRSNDVDVKPGDLVSFCTHLGTRLRIRGEWHYAVHQDHLGIVIDDSELLASL